MRLRVWPCVVLVSSLIVTSSPASAEIGPVGVEFQVNSVTAGTQQQPSLAMFPGGGFVVVWQDYDFEDIEDSNVFGQRFDSVGGKVGAEFLVNSYTDQYQDYADVAAGSDGSFVVVWMSRHNQDGDARGVFGQRYDSGGGVVGAEFQVNSTTEDFQRYPAIAIQPNGDFVVVWGSDGQDGSQEGAFGQRFSSSGDKIGPEFQVNSHTLYSQSAPQVAVDGEGDFVVLWKSSIEDQNDIDIRGQRFDSAGVMLGTEFAVNSSTEGQQVGIAIATDADGDFVVVWSSYETFGDPAQVLGQRFASSGELLGGEFQVSSSTGQSQYTTLFNWVPQAVASEPDGDFVVVWTRYFSEDEYADLFGQSFTSSGDRLGAEFQINAYSTDGQYFPAIAIGADGAFVVVWESWSQDGEYQGVFGRRFSMETAGPVLDLDGDGVLRPLTDGLLLLRDLSGFSGPTLVAGALGEACTRCEPEEIEAHVASNMTSLDIDGSGETEPLSDGVLVVLYLFGFRDAALFEGAVEMDCARCEFGLIEEQLDSLD